MKTKRQVGDEDQVTQGLLSHQKIMAFIQIDMDVIMVLNRGMVCSNYILKGSLWLLCRELTVG